MNMYLPLLMAAPEGDQNPLMSLIPWVGVFVVFYFFMIRPQMKKNKEMKQFRENLKKGQQVVTIGGIHGKIKDLGETTVTIETGAGSLKIEKSALSVSGAAGIVPEKK